MQFKDPASDRDGVTGIIAAVIAGGEIRLCSKPIHDAAFALIPPLCTYNHLQGHGFSFPKCVRSGEIPETLAKSDRRGKSRQSLIPLYQAHSRWGIIFAR